MVWITFSRNSFLRSKLADEVGRRFSAAVSSAGFPKGLRKPLCAAGGILKGPRRRKPKWNRFPASNVRISLARSVSVFDENYAAARLIRPSPIETRCRWALDGYPFPLEISAAAPLSKRKASFRFE